VFVEGKGGSIELQEILMIYVVAFEVLRVVEMVVEEVEWSIDKANKKEIDVSKNLMESGRIEAEIRLIMHSINCIYFALYIPVTSRDRSNSPPFRLSSLP
jgi:hypothetical protein